MSTPAVAASEQTGLKFFAAAAAAAAALLLAFGAAGPEEAEWLVKHGGWWVQACLFSAWAVVFARAAGGFFRGARRHVVREHRAGLLAAAACSVFLHLHEPHRLKVMYDEAVLLGTSRNMHYERAASCPLEARYESGLLRVTHDFVDKRPCFFPFLVSLLHDALGYRPENPLLLNALLTPVVLLLIYGWGVKIGGREYGMLGMILFASLPLAAQNATSGGFDFLNVCLILGFLHAGSRYVSRECPRTLHLFLLTALLLAHTRYESILYCLTAAGLAGLVWARRGKARLTWPAASAPLLLVPPLLSLRIFISRQHFLQTRPGEAFFSLENFSGHAARALFYFFNYGDDFTNSLLVSALGAAALPFVLLYFGRRHRRILGTPGPETVFCGALATVAAAVLLLFSFFWGQLDDPRAARLSLPLQTMLVLCVCYALKLFLREKPLPPAALWAAVLLGMFPAASNNARHTMTNQLPESRETLFFTSFIEARAEADALICLKSPTVAVGYQRAAVHLSAAAENPAGMADYLDQGVCREIYIMGTFQQTEASIKDELWRKLARHYDLETLAERSFNLGELTRICRVIRVKAPAPAPAASRNAR